MRNPVVSAPAITVNALSFSWGNQPVCQQLSLSLRGGKTTALLGRSGSGKSTLLRLIAGLLLPAGGDVTSSDGLPLPGRISWMGQQDLLYPWLTARENVMLAARLNGEKADGGRADELLEQVGLGGLAEAKPAALSGGMRQRVALARTLYPQRPVVLMDEPFATLDVLTKLSLQTLTANLLRDKTVLLVTHDPLEACRMADDIGVLTGNPLRYEPFGAPEAAPPREVSDAGVLHQQGRLFSRLSRDER